MEAPVAAMADRPLPRLVTSLLVSGAVAVGSYELAHALETPAADHNARVEACADMLDVQPEHVRTQAMPDACEPFQTSFSYRDTTVRVVDRTAGEEASQTQTHTRTYDLPGRAAFRAANIETPQEEARQESVEKKAALAIGGLYFLTAFSGLSFIARLRRKQSNANAEAEAGTEPA